MATETLSTSTEDVSAINEKNKKILDALDITDPKGEELKKVIGELSKPEVLASIQDATKATIHNSALVIMNSGWPNNDRERLILQLQARLFPSVALNMKIEQTAKPSESLKGIIKQDGTIDTEALKNLSTDQIREKMGKLNKADIKKLVGSLEGIDWLLKQTLMQVVTPFVETMVQNGFSLESATDVDFLSKNGSEKTKKVIEDWKTKVGEKPFDNGKKYIIKWENILPLSNEKWELTAAGIDISKINTVDPKSGAEQLKKQLPANFDKAKFGEFINNLMKSDSKLFKWLGEILKIFWALLGIDFGEKTEAWKEKLNGKQKRELLVKIGKKNDDYDVSTFFDTTWNPVDKKDDLGFQKYLGDIDKILWPGYVTKSPDGKLFIFDKRITEGALTLQGTYKIEPKTGKFDAASITKLLEKMDPDWKLIETPQAPAPGPAPAPAQNAPESISEQPHKLKWIMEELRGLDFSAIRKSKDLTQKIQAAFGIQNENWYGPRTINAVKQFQINELKMEAWNLSNQADWKIWKYTVDKFFEVFKKWMTQPQKAPDPKPA